MGVFITIRHKFGYLLIFVIAFAIVGFLLMDAVQSNTNMFQPTDNTAGKVNGTEVSNAEYQRKVDETIASYTMNTGTTNIPEETMFQLREQAWEQYVKEKLMGVQYNELGLSITKQELYDMLQGDNPHPVVVQQFTDPNTGRFSPQQISNFIQNLDIDDQNMSSTEKKARWKNFETFIKTDRLEAKYNNLVKQSVYATDLEAEKTYTLNNTTVDVQYVAYLYAQVADDAVKVTDADLKDYLNEHPGRFKQNESRTVDFVTFEVKASPQDTAEALASITALAEKFAKANNDSVFVKLYSEVRFDPTYYGVDELPSSVADTFFKVDSATVIGPYQEDGYFVLGKLVDRKMIADSVEARQIVFRPESQPDVALKKAQADSLKILLEEGKVDFESLVLQYSDDDETKFDGGNMGWVKPGDKFETIDKALFYEYKEKDYFVVGSDFAFHLIQITKAKPTKEGAKVAFVKQEIRPSKSTSNLKFNEANKFLGEFGTEDKFKKADVNIRTSEPLAINANVVSGLGEARDLVKWAYSAKVGEVSNVFILDDKFVIALLTEARAKGIATVENVRGELENLVKQEKKADYIKEKIAGKTDLAAIASANNLEVKSAAGLSFTNTDVGGANEPKVAGASLALANGAVSKPIQGSVGVYVVKVTDKNDPAAASGYSVQKQQISQTTKFRVDNMLYNAIKEASDVEDQRYKFY